MHIDPRLTWLQANRRRPESVRRVGALVQSLAEGACLDAAERGELEGRIREATDEDFRAFCRVGRVEGGTLVIRVNNPAAVNAMRRRWEEPLLRALRNTGSKGRKIRRLVFEYGNG